MEGTLEVGGLALETTDAAVAMAGLDGRVAFEWVLPDAAGMRLAANGVVHDGQILVGNTYVALSGVPVRVAVEVRRLPGGGWRLPRLALHDGDTLQAEADAVLAADGALQRLSLQARSARLAGLPARYLSGWLGLAGLSGLELAGAADATVRVAEGALEALDGRAGGTGGPARTPAIRLPAPCAIASARPRAHSPARRCAADGLGPVALALSSRDGDALRGTRQWPCSRRVAAAGFRTRSDAGDGPLVFGLN